MTIEYVKTWNNIIFPIESSLVDKNKVLKKKNLNYIKYKKCEGIDLYKKNNFRIIDCKKCNFIHTIPLPSQSELDDFYLKTFYSQERKSDYFEGQKKQLGWWNNVFDERLKNLENILGRKGRILDIGCGPGFFLHRAFERGWDVAGIEPSSDAVNYANNFLGLNIKCKRIEDIYDINEKFDVVYSHGVLEHLRNPKLIFELCKTINQKHNLSEILCFISVANDFNPFQFSAIQSNKIEPWFIIPPEHLNYFNHSNFSRFAKSNNVKILKMTSSFPIDSFLLAGINYIGDSSLGKQCHTYRVNFEKSLDNNGLNSLRNAIYDDLATKGLGRQIDFYGSISLT